MISSIVLIVGLSAVVYAGSPTLNGPCPDFKAMENVDASRMTGEWFQHFRGKTGIQERKPSVRNCEKGVVSIKGNNVIELLATFNDGDGNQKSITTTATAVGGPAAKFTLASDSFKDKSVTVVGVVLDTDYTSYLTSLNCFSDGSKHGYVVDVHGRGKTFSAAEAEKAKQVLTSVNVQLETVPQNC